MNEAQKFILETVVPSLPDKFIVVARYDTFLDFMKLSGIKRNRILFVCSGDVNELLGIGNVFVLHIKIPGVNKEFDDEVLGRLSVKRTVSYKSVNWYDNSENDTAMAKQSFCCVNPGCASDPYRNGFVHVCNDHYSKMEEELRVYRLKEAKESVYKAIMSLSARDIEIMKSVVESMVKKT